MRIFMGLLRLPVLRLRRNFCRSRPLCRRRTVGSPRQGGKPLRPRLHRRNSRFGNGLRHRIQQRIGNSVCAAVYKIHADVAAQLYAARSADTQFNRKNEADSRSLSHKKPSIFSIKTAPPKFTFGRHVRRCFTDARFSTFPATAPKWI